MKSKKILITSLIIGFVVLNLIAVFIGYIYISKNDYVFKVNGEKVTMSEFNTYLKLQKKIMEEQFGESVWDVPLNEVPAIETARDSAKQSIVDTKVKLQHARELKIALTNVEKQSIRDLFDESKDINVASEAYGLSVEEITSIRARVAEMLKEYEITLDEMMKINEDAQIMKKLEEYYSTSYDSRHILFVTQGKTDVESAEIKKKAEDVLTRIKNGEDFAALAAEFSEDPGSKDNGGLYLGTVLNQFVEEYETAALSLNVGEVYSELVKTSYGYHIIKLEGVKNKDVNWNELVKQWNSEAVVDNVNEQQYNSAV